MYMKVATALLVAGSTLTFWIPWQTSFASTSSYSRLFKVYQYNGSFQLMHTSSQDSAVSVAQDSLDEQQLAVVYQ